MRRLARNGRIPAKKLGRDWLLLPASVESLQQRKRRGRPLSSANAWALLALLSGDSPRWVDARVRFRLNGYLESSERLLQLLALSEARANVHSLWLPPDDLSRLGQEPGLVRSGLAAAAAPELDLFFFEPVFDAYVDQRRLKSVIARYQPLADSDQPNLWLRVPSNRWVLRKESKAPLAVIAADLLGHPDQRVDDAGRDVLRKLLNRG